MSQSSLTEIIAFVDRCQDQNLVLVRKYQADIERLLHGFKAIREKVIENARTTAPDFNIFEILGLSRSENRTHSNMLAHLLSPTADHGQQFLFLKNFIHCFVDNSPEFQGPSATVEEGHWEVFTEYKISDLSRLDIVIRSLDLAFLCVIENKIDADEQPGQLSRYSQWMVTQHEDFPNQILLFLSPDGRPSITAGNYPYIPISYRQDITGWLVNTLEHIQAPNVREIVSEYCDLVKDLL